MKLAELQELESRWVMQTYRRAPVEFVRGEGARLWDPEGKEYLDFVSGISVCSIGHSHPAVVGAVRDQVGRLTHTSNLYLTGPGIRLAERLCRSSLGGRAFLCNSGTEANECAIKLARKHAHGRLPAGPARRPRRPRRRGWRADRRRDARADSGGDRGPRRSG
jgi:acetylornithine/N-succinyldiaminopimelate aminotransferase